MNVLIFPLSIVCGLALGTSAISVLMAYRAHRLLAELNARAQFLRAQKEVELQPLRDTVEVLTTQVRDLQIHPNVPLPGGAPRAGFNLNKRSQALRMHRRGEAAEQIATSLELPRQEVELLLKVHGIVLQNV
jgi:hypothetical protein